MKRLLITREDFAKQFPCVPLCAPLALTGAFQFVDEDDTPLETYIFVQETELKPEAAVWVNPNDQTQGWIYPAKTARDIHELHRMLALNEDN
jgi:hypothetical protein